LKASKPGTDATLWPLVAAAPEWVWGVLVRYP